MDKMFKLLQDWGWNWIQFECSDGTYSIMIGMKHWFTSNLAQTRILPTGRGTSFEEAWTELVTTYGENVELLKVGK